MITLYPSRSRIRRRGASSLIEVIAAMTVMAVLFGTTASLTALLFRLERLGRDDLAATITGGRLASDLRSDVQAALHAEGEADADELVLTGPGDQEVSYRVEGHTITRTLRTSDEVGRLETYRLRPKTLARWDFAESDDRPRVWLILEAPHANDAARHVTRIGATLGRDHRFEEDGS